MIRYGFSHPEPQPVVELGGQGVPGQPWVLKIPLHLMRIVRKYFPLFIKI